MPDWIIFLWYQSPLILVPFNSCFCFYIRSFLERVGVWRGGEVGKHVARSFESLRWLLVYAQRWYSITITNHEITGVHSWLHSRGKNITQCLRWMTLFGVRVWGGGGLISRNFLDLRGARKLEPRNLMIVTVNASALTLKMQRAHFAPRVLKSHANYARLFCEIRRGGTADVPARINFKLSCWKSPLYITNLCVGPLGVDDQFTFVKTWRVSWSRDFVTLFALRVSRGETLGMLRAVIDDWAWSIKISTLHGR